jgi:hypothetical protein
MPKKAYWGFEVKIPPRHLMQASGQLHALATLALKAVFLLPTRRKSGLNTKPFWMRHRKDMANVLPATNEFIFSPFFTPFSYNKCLVQLLYSVLRVVEFQLQIKEH